MADSVFKNGSPLMVDYTPSGADIALGQVKLVGDIPCIAHRPITDGEKGALAAGGGVYTVTGDAAIAVGKKVYWNDSANKVTETSSGNKVIGFTVTACSADGSTCDIVHNVAI